ncbi:MAG: flagellar motor switch protein FliN [Microbacteriaceae bacterium]|nr:MAG: flagellar motor switch protein FliN [Microbacteriaceae bacterium]
MTITADLTDIFARTLAEKLPTTKMLTPVRSAEHRIGDIDVTAAIVTTFVGRESYDIAVALQRNGTLELAGGAAVSTEDLVHNALTDASSVLGDGVLGRTVVDNAAGLFADAATAIVHLLDDAAIVGLLGIRRRVSAGSPRDTEAQSKLGRINNVEMALTVEIGRTRMSVRDVLNLEPGAVVELDRSAGAPADILLNGRLIAYGEVVVVDQDYAVRVTQIIDAQDVIA